MSVKARGSALSPIIQRGAIIPVKILMTASIDMWDSDIFITQNNLHYT